MNQNIKKSILLVCIFLTCLILRAQDGNCCTDKIIGNTTVATDINSSHYIVETQMDEADFDAVGEFFQEFGHIKNGKFEKWKSNPSNNPQRYMFYQVFKNGSIHIYNEEINQKLDERCLRKGTLVFNQQEYQKYFGKIDFSADYWNKNDNSDRRMSDMKNLAKNLANNLGITLETEKVTYRLYHIEGMRMYIPDNSGNDRKDDIRGYANWDDKVTQIEFDKYHLNNGTVSDAISTTAEEVYHRYQMQEVRKYMAGQTTTEPTAKVKSWYESFNAEAKIRTEIERLYKINPEKETELAEQYKNAYFNFAHEKDAKEYASKIAATEYFGRNVKTK